MIDDQLFTELQELYNQNVNLFQQQNTGYLVEKIHPLTIEALEKVIAFNGLVDKKYIREHYRNFTINPQITEIKRGFTTQIELSPDISWEVKK